MFGGGASLDEHDIAAVRSTATARYMLYDPPGYGKLQAWLARAAHSTDDKHVNPIREGSMANWPAATFDDTPCKETLHR